MSPPPPTRRARPTTRRGAPARSRRTLRRLGLALACVLGLLAAPARTATYDPDLTWRTIVTDHFRVHFHQGLEALADDFAVMVEEVYDEVSPELAWRARMKVDVVLIDRTDRANGNATAVPYNLVNIYVTAPQEDSTLSLYEDWSRAIFTHELTHVLHLESNHGIVRAARAVVGRIASTNAVSPWWTVEGLATFEETRLTPGGRGRSPYVDMIERAAVLDDAFPALGNLDGLQARLPAGNLRYLFGQDFMQYVADHTGEDVWTRWIHTYGGHVPYLLPTKKVFGRKLQGLYAGWREDMHRRYRAQFDAVAREGLREGEALSAPGLSCASPSFSPDDHHLVWSCWDPRTGNALWRAEADGTGPEILKQDFGAKTFTWRRDSEAFVYAATHIVNRFNVWSDIYLFSMGSKRPQSLTRGARARDPDFSPDGTQLVVVTNRAQRNRLEILTVDRTATPITTDENDTQYATPRWHPSGEQLAVSVWRDGRRDLWLYAADGTPLRRLTHDVANDRDPAWSSDGRWLYFVSERSGIANIYAIELETERLWQVTNVRTGAARPSLSADDRRLAFQLYRATGWEVRMMEVDPAGFLDRGLLPRPLDDARPLAEVCPPVDAPARPDDDAVVAWVGEPLGPIRKPGAPLDLPDLAHLPPAQDAGGLDTFEQTEVEDAFGEEQDFPFRIAPRRYNPLPSLAPRYWVPSFQATPRLPQVPDNAISRWLGGLPRPLNLPGVLARASTGASDPLRRYGWSAFVDYRTDANFVGGGGSFTLNHYLPVFTVSANTQAVPRTYARVDEAASTPEALAFQEAPAVYFERRINAAFAFSYPFTPRSTVFANYTFSDRRIRGELAPDAHLPSVALRGTLGTVAAGYRYSWGQQTATSISREDARNLSLVGSVTAPWLGTFAEEADGTRAGVTQVLLSAEIREYLAVPKVPNHVIALRGATGVALGGGDRFVGNYSLGGSIGDSAFYVRPAEYRMIRGYPFGADRGDTYWLAAAEYRLPIWRMDRGFGTVPAFFRVLHGAVFVDAGNAFEDVTGFVDVFDDALVGVGAELRLSTVVGWSGAFDFRLGYAAGLTQNGYFFDDPRSVYFQLGGAF